MEGLFTAIINCLPRQNLTDLLVRSPAYTILCAQAPNVSKRLKLLRKRLATATEENAVQNIIHVVNSCVSNDVCPNDVEEMMEELAQMARLHKAWGEFVSWVFALAQYYCTDDFTVSLFMEFELPSVAIEASKENAMNEKLIMVIIIFLKHYSHHELPNIMTELLRLLNLYKCKRDVARVILTDICQYTCFSSNCNDKSVHNSEEFVQCNGVNTLHELLTLHEHDTDIVKLVVDVCMNVLVSGVTINLDNTDVNIINQLSEQLNSHKNSEELIIAILRVFAHYPRSASINWTNVSSLLRREMPESVLVECMKFLTTVAMTTKETKRKMYECGCIERVITVMHAYLANALLQENGCSLLSYLSFDSESITSSITELEGIQLILDAMRCHNDNEQLLLTACAALSGLTFNNHEGQEVVYRSNGVATVLEAMRSSAKAKLQENACLALGTMCWNNNLKRDVVRLGGISCITRALQEHVSNAGVVKNACRAIAQIVFNNDHFRQQLSAAHVIPLIIEGMSQHPLYDRVQLHGCLALSYLCWTNNTNTISNCTGNYNGSYAYNNNNNNNNNNTHDGYQAVLRAMALHPHNSEVQEHACRALANINAVPASECTVALEHVLSAMRHHAHVGEVQEAGCRAIVTLALIAPANKDELFRLGAAEVTISAMQFFASNQLVQQEACNALAHLAYEHSNLNRAITSCNGVQLLLNAMRNHKDNNKLQLSACGGLSALAFDNTVAQRQIYELDGVKEIIYAMEHTERIRMLELGCSVLGTLAWNTEIKEKVALQAVPEILKQMRAHQASALLQKSTCRAISQFAFNSEANRRLLVELGVIPLIVRGMREHVTTEKLIVHAIKALTYLCWENSEVAEAIIREGIEAVLQMVVKHYMHAPRVYNEAIHLSKILFRKTNGGLSPVHKTISPPLISPVPLSHTPSSPCAMKLQTASNSTTTTLLSSSSPSATARATTTTAVETTANGSSVTPTLTTPTPVYSVITESNHNKNNNNSNNNNNNTMLTLPANLPSYIPAFSNQYGYIVVPTSVYQPAFQLSLLTPALQPVQQLSSLSSSSLPSTSSLAVAAPVPIPYQTSSSSPSCGTVTSVAAGSSSSCSLPMPSVITLSPSVTFPANQAPPPPYSENAMNNNAIMTPLTTQATTVNELHMESVSDTSSNYNNENSVNKCIVNE